MNSKIFFTDLDGTLLNDRKEITPGNRAAISEALSAGHKIVIATGRPLASARIQAERLGLTGEGCYAITYNGGLIYDSFHRNVLLGTPVPKELLAPIFTCSHAMGIHIHTYSSTHILSEYETPELREYAATTLLPWTIVPSIEEVRDFIPYKMLAISSPEKLLALQKELQTHYSGILESFFSCDVLLEIVPAGVSKGFALKWMCDYLGIPLANSVAVGDAQNDIPMLEAAHIGAVMANALPEIAAHGNYVTTADNNHDGVAEIIRKFIL